MRVVDNRFICTEKEMQDLKLIDHIFSETCFVHACYDCPFRTEGKRACTVYFFTSKFMRQVSLEGTEEEK